MSITGAVEAVLQSELEFWYKGFGWMFMANKY